MSVSFSGNYPTRTRILTGLTSLDIACAGSLQRKELGLPLRCGYHMHSSKSGIGKTTLALSVAGLISKATKKNMKILAIDTFDLRRAQTIIEYSGAEGECEFLFEDDPVEQVEKLYKGYQEKNTVVTVLDSVNMAMSKANIEGASGDSNVGKDAFFMSNHLRKMYHETAHAKMDKVFIITNVAYANLMSFAGNHTKGGHAPNDLTSIHMNISQGKIGNANVSYPTGKLLNIRIDKNNFGITGQTAQVFTLGETGIHIGLTAVFDCLRYGYATFARSKFTLNGESAGSIHDMLANPEAIKMFTPFIETLKLAQDDILAGVKIKPVKSTDEGDDEDE
jgi:energy-coupling factor transporter ATP-binding protein EcfA2